MWSGTILEPIILERGKQIKKYGHKHHIVWVLLSFNRAALAFTAVVCDHFN